MIDFTTLKNFNRAKKYPRNTIIAKDTAGTGMVVILKGEAGVFANYVAQGKERIGTLGPGDFFGESALFLGKSSPAAAVALTDVIALPIGADEAQSFIHEEPDMAFELMKAICGRLNQVSAAYEKLAGRPWAQGAPAHAQAPAAMAPKPQETQPASAAPCPPQAKQAPQAQPAPAAAAQTPQPGAGGSLFPEGHGSYQLKIDNDDHTYLMEKGFTCPVCKAEFSAPAVRGSRLVQEGTDGDMRHRYRGVEPLYYDVVTCPHCLYSALGELFASPDVHKAGQLQEVQALAGELGPLFAAPRSTDAVFAGYYLALLCAPKCFAKHHLASAKLLLKLSRVYQDCGDGRLEQETAKRALDEYLYLYLNEQGDPTQDQQLCVVIGELSLKMGDLRNAREYYLKAKMIKGGSPLLKSQAEARLMDMRGMDGKS